MHESLHGARRYGGAMASILSRRLGRRIRALRLERSWRQIDLAAHAQLSKTHVCDIETSRREICLGTLEKLARALDTTPSDLLK
ncbi:MAG TPA: helix-turn-helix transcriptional regulator [Acidobacteriaceae bacterium]|nr:helix-turn-helix transcriptional regulator [Acidobacteriaceae bacterium]